MEEEATSWADLPEELCGSPWSHLPEELCVLVFKQLSCEDRLLAAFVCTTWNHAFHAGSLWKNLTIQFKDESDAKMKRIALLYGKYFKRLHIKCYQQKQFNTDNTCAFLDILANQKNLRLAHFKLELCEQNPFFYTGGRFLNSLGNLFSSPAVSQLKSLDFSKFPLAFTDTLINIITQNIAPTVQVLNIQNKILASRLSPGCLVEFIKQANNLTQLAIRSTYFTSQVISVLTDYKMNKLRLVSLLFSRADKFMKVISGADWQRMAEVLPLLRVAMKFDHTYPMHCTFQVMAPEVPISILKLCLHAICYEHVNMAAEMYQGTLEKLVVMSTPSSDLDDAVLRVVRQCKEVKDLHVYCRMDEDVVKQIHGEKNFRKYTLPYLNQNTTAVN